MNLLPSYISNSEYRDIKRFFTKLILFALLVFSVDKAFAYWATQAVLNDTAAFGSLSLLYRGEVNSQVVFFGSSKILVNIDAAVVEEKTGLSCYNLAIGGASLDMCDFLFEEYLLRNKKPDFVFMDADFSQVDTSTLAFRYEMLAPFSNVSTHTAQRLNPRLTDQIAFWFFRCKNYSSGGGIGGLGRSMFRYAKNVFAENISLTDYQQSASAVGLSGNVDLKESRGSYLATPRKQEELNEDWRKDRGAGTQISPERRKTYQRIVKLTESKGITLILFGPPFLGNKLDKNFAEEVDQFFSQLAEQNDHVHYWSFREDTQLRSDIAFWIDPIHVNWNGAEILSSKIAEKIKTLLTNNK